MKMMSGSPSPMPMPMPMLPHPGPATEPDKLLLFALRRMAHGGLNDAFAAHALVSAFGRGFRRPLVLLRATMAEISRVSAQVLMIAPCCCPRTTADEHALMAVISQAGHDPRDAHDRLAALLKVHNCHGAADVAQALSESFSDLGRPLAVTAG